MKTIKIFLASSEELRDERLEIADLVGHLNKTLERSDKNILLVKWEYLDSSMGPERKQEEYNRELRGCEMCIVLYWNTFGSYTTEELDTAYGELRAGRNPHKLYVYFKDSDSISEDLKEFRDSFSKRYGHFYSHFANIDTLKADFLLQFIDYQQLGSTSLVEVKDSQVMIDGKAYVDLTKVPFAGNNEDYKELRDDIEELKEWMEEHETDHPRYAAKAEKLRVKQERLKRMESSLWETALMITRLSTTKCSERLERAMKLFSEGDNHGANAILNEEEIDHDVQHNLNLVKLGEEGRKGLETNIEEYELKIKTLENEMSEGWGDQVIALRKKVLEICQSLYGEMSAETAKAYFDLSDSSEFFARYDDALKYGLKSLEIRLGVLGVEHSDTAKSYNNIGVVYYEQGDYAKALEYYEKALQINEKVLGAEHPNTAMSYNNFGTVYDDRGDYAKALEYYEKALQISENVLGTEHPDTAGSYNNIGAVYYNQGEYTKALEYYEKALQIKEKVLGVEHPVTAGSYNNIGIVYEELGEYAKALEYHLKALQIKEKVLGAEHPVTAGSYNNIGVVYRVQGDYAKALEYFTKALQIYENVLGAEHPDTAGSYHNIGFAYEEQGDYAKALEWYHKALQIREKVLVVEHPVTACSYNNIGNVYEEQGEYAKALEYYGKALQIREKVLGAEHPDTVMSYNNIGNVYFKMEDFEKAIEYYLKAAEQGNARSMYQLAKIYSDELNDFETAKIWYAKVGDNGDPAGYNQIAWEYHLQGKYPEALPWAEKAVGMAPEDPNIIDTLATVYQDLGRYDEAMQQFELCLKLASELGADEEFIKHAEDKIAELRQLMN